MGKESRARVLNGLGQWNWRPCRRQWGGDAGIVTATHSDPPTVLDYTDGNATFARTNSIGQVVMVMILRRMLAICLLIRKRRESRGVEVKRGGKDGKSVSYSRFSTLFFSEQVCEFCVCFHHMSEGGVMGVPWVCHW